MKGWFIQLPIAFVETCHIIEISWIRGYGGLYVAHFGKPHSYGRTGKRGSVNMPMLSKRIFFYMPALALLVLAGLFTGCPVAARAARDLGIPRESCNLVVAHLGGGISIAAHRGMLIVDTSDPRGEGPFCMDRTGALHALELAKLCYSGKYTKEEMLKQINGGGGVVAYCKTRDFRDVLRMHEEKDPTATAVYEALAYQIAKEIGSQTAVLRGKVDAIVFTGGMAYNESFINDISEYVSCFAKIIVYPGESELEALAAYICQVQSGEIKPIVYVN